MSHAAGARDPAPPLRPGGSGPSPTVRGTSRRAADRTGTCGEVAGAGTGDGSALRTVSPKGPQPQFGLIR